MDPALATRPHPSHTGERRLYAVVRIRTLAGGPGINTDRCPWLVGTGPLFAVPLACSADQYRLEDPMPDPDTAHEGACPCRPVRYPPTALTPFVLLFHCRWSQTPTGPHS